MSKNLMLLKTSKIVSAILVLVGVGMIFTPYFLSLSLATPQSFPWIPENYYSSGEIDYVSYQTGKYYLAVLPQSEKNVAITSAKAAFEGLGKEFSMDYKGCITGDPTYDQYSFWWETNVTPDDLEFNTEYIVTFSVVDEKGRSHQVTTQIMFIPKELLPLPEGYFLINGEEMNTAITLETPVLVISFVPTENEEFLTHVTAKIYKDSELIMTIPTIDIEDYYPQFRKQDDDTWLTAYTLPSHGNYLLEGFAGTAERNVKLMSVMVDYSKELQLFNIYNIMWWGGGILLILIGIATYVKPVKTIRRT